LGRAVAAAQLGARPLGAAARRRLRLGGRHPGGARALGAAREGEAAVRWLGLLLLCNCGLLFDGAYLLSDKHTTKTEAQRRPTGERETQPELSLGYDGPRLRVTCEAVTRSVDRVWNVDKVYEYQGGFYQAHLTPVIIEGALGTGLGIGLGIKCADPSSNIPCSTLYGTLPL